MWWGNGSTEVAAAGLACSWWCQNRLRGEGTQSHRADRWTTGAWTNCLHNAVANQQSWIRTLWSEIQKQKTSSALNQVCNCFLWNVLNSTSFWAPVYSSIKGKGHRTTLRENNEIRVTPCMRGLARITTVFHSDRHSPGSIIASVHTL